MFRWRFNIALVLALFLAIPLSQPLLLLIAEPRSWMVWTDAPRLLTLSKNTLVLIGCTLTLSLPLGILGAILLYRTDLPWRGFLRFLAFLTLFVPLPLVASGWQTILGSGGWLPLPIWNQSRDADPGFASGGTTWTPWGQGMGSAVWIHAVAALPWVILLVGQSLCWVERELEEDALTATGPWRVLVNVTLPRSGAGIGMAAIWVTLQTATEITVTDVMQVRTLAEEVYTQFVVPDPVVPGEQPGGPLARALAVTLPFILITAGLLVWMASVFDKTIPAHGQLLSSPFIYRLGRRKWGVWVGVVVVGCLLFACPWLSLLWRAGLEGVPPAWSARSVLWHMSLVQRTEGPRLRDTLLVAAGAAVMCTILGLTTCWAALGTRRFRAGILVLMALAWATPGPVLGMGLHATIDRLLSLTQSAWLRQLLWDGPSSAPILWVDLIRFFPCAVAVLWPVVRFLPAELRDQARVDGARPGQELLRVVVPLCAVGALRAGLAVAVLSLGELSAGKLVSTPDQATYAEALFVQMHYGITNDLAARCLWLLAVVAVGGGMTGSVTAVARRSGFAKDYRTNPLAS